MIAVTLCITVRACLAHINCSVVAITQDIGRIMCVMSFLFQAEDGRRDLVRSRGLGDVYKRQVDLPREPRAAFCIRSGYLALRQIATFFQVAYDEDPNPDDPISICLLYTSPSPRDRTRSRMPSSA